MAQNPNKPFHKIGLYIRVSTEEQAENPEGSIKNQEERLRAAVQLKNMEAPFGEIAGVFVDRARSGKDTNRPELQRLLRAIQGREISLVMVSELSRLSRSMKDFAQIWELMQANSCDFYSLRESFDTTTAAGEMVLFTIANIAQFERKQVSERVAANMASRASRGLYNGGRIAVGYKRVPDQPGLLQIDEEYAPTIHASFRAMIDQGSLASAAKWLNANGFKLKRDKDGGGSRLRLGHFTVENLHDVVKNRGYLGLRQVREKGQTKEVKALWPAIIEEETFDRVKEILTKNRRRLKPERYNRYPYLLSQLVTCETCGGSLCGKSAHGNSGKIPYYEHGWLTKRNGCMVKPAFNCKPFRIPGRILEPLVWEQIERLLSQREFAEEVLARARNKLASDEAQDRLKKAETKIRSTQEQVELLAERLGTLPKSISPETIYRQMEKLQAQKIEDERLFQTLRLDLGGKDSVAEFSEYARFLDAVQKLKDATQADSGRAKVVKALVHKVGVTPGGFKIYFRVGQDKIKGELATAGSPLLKNSLFRGSNTLTNGGLTKNRTWNGPLGKGCYIHLTMRPSPKRSSKYRRSLVVGLQ